MQLTGLSKCAEEPRLVLCDVALRTNTQATATAVDKKNYSLATCTSL